MNVNLKKNRITLCSAVQTIEKKSGLLADDEITPPLRFPPAEVWKNLILLFALISFRKMFSQRSVTKLRMKIFNNSPIICIIL
jgi:hypothetical protein